MSEDTICGKLGVAWGVCHNSPKYPDGRCETHSDYAENTAGPTATVTKEVCEQLREGSVKSEAFEAIEGASKTSLNRWMERAEDSVDSAGIFGHDCVEFRALVERAESDENRAPHRWLREAANRIDFAVSMLEDDDPAEAAALDEYATTLRSKADEFEAAGRKLGNADDGL